MTEKQFIEIFDYIKKYLRLQERDIRYKISEDGWSQINIELEYLQADIFFDKNILEQDISDIVQVITHEFCHIYTWARADAMLQIMKDNIANDIGENTVTKIYNSTYIISEMYTTRLEKVFTQQLYKSERYKKLRKKFPRKKRG